MSHQTSLVLQLLAGVALFLGGVWCLCVRLPLERARRKRMVAATGTIRDGAGASNVFKHLSAAVDGAGAAAMPMVHYVTADDREVVANTGLVRGGGRGARRTVFVVGQQVALTYDPQDPKIVAIDGQPTRVGFFNMICAILLICGLALALSCLRELMSLPS